MVRLEKELVLRGFSGRTITAYLYYNKELLRFANPKFSKEINRQDVKDYLDYLISSKKSEATINLAINALKFYYEKILLRSFFKSNLGIARPKRPKKLPVVLSKKEAESMINILKNSKHKTILAILYGCGLRISELVKIKVKDIDIERKVLKISQGKGKKDRYTILPNKIIDVLENQMKLKNYNDYLFTGRNRRGPINIMSINKIVKKSADLAKIKKDVSPHTFRHSFATHLLENGVNLRYIQTLLGHARLETTQIYTKVANNKLRNIESPLD